MNKADEGQTITFVTVKVGEWHLIWGQVDFLTVNPKIIQDYPPRYRLGWAGEGFPAGKILRFENLRAGGAKPECIPTGELTPREGGQIHQTM